MTWMIEQAISGLQIKGLKAEEEIKFFDSFAATVYFSQQQKKWK